ncbi:MAG: CPBP family glutamic-type intramembrane protease [Chloroflexota bacterium]
MENAYLQAAQQGKNEVWRYVVVILAVMTVIFSVQIIAIIPFFLIEGTTDLNQLSPISLLLLTMLPFPFAGLTILAGVAFLHRRPLKSIFRPVGAFQWRRMLLSGVVWFGLSAAADLVLAQLQPGNYVWNFNLLEFLPYFVLAVLLIPLQTSTEELLFRGYLTQWLGRYSKGLWLPLIAPSLFFMLLHGANPEVGTYGLWFTMPFYLGIGLLLGWVTLRSEGLELALGLHAANNLYAALAVTFPSSAIPSPALFRIQNYDAAAGLIVFAVMAVLYLLIINGLRLTRRVQVAVSVLVGLALLGGLVQPAAAKSYSAERFDVEIQVQPNGDLLVTETVVFHFEGGPFTFAFREVSKNELDRLEFISAGMDGIALPPGNQPGQVEVKEGGDAMEVVWHFEPTSDAQRTFELTYRVIGAVRQTELGDGLMWVAIPPEHEYVIRGSEIRLMLPDGIAPLAEVKLRGEAIEPLAEDGSFLFRVGEISADQELTVEAYFPAGSLIQQPPQWQAVQLERGRQLRAALPYGAGLAVLIILACFAAAGRIQRKYALDTSTIIPSGTITDPPDDLTPAAAGFILSNGNITVMDLFAVLLQWARRSFIKMDLVEGKGIFKARDFRLYPLQPVNGTEHESLLHQLVFPAEANASQAEILLSKAGQNLARKVAQFKRLITEELAGLGLVRQEVMKVRGRLNAAAGFLFLFAFVIGLMGLLLGGMAFTFPFMGVLLMGIALGLMVGSFFLWIAGYKLNIFTPAGMQRLQRWLSFRNYLRDLIKPENSQLLRQEWLEAYLPYAVAFGLGDRWVKAFRNRGLSTLLSWAYSSEGAGVESAVLTAVITTSSLDSSSGGGGGGGSGGGSSGAG